jgi:hypothetical protein
VRTFAIDVGGGSPSGTLFEPAGATRGDPKATEEVVMNSGRVFSLSFERASGEVVINNSDGLDQRVDDG